jgi:serine/threonine-protein kinase
MSPDVAPDPSLEHLTAVLDNPRYRPLARLGGGAMGQVYLVEHVELGRRFALKILREEFACDAEFVDRMRLEAQAVARLYHPNVVEVTDFWLTRTGLPCILMEHLTGRTLGR